MSSLLSLFSHASLSEDNSSFAAVKATIESLNASVLSDLNPKLEELVGTIAQKTKENDEMAEKTR
jgi:hypothetical protein